MALWDKIKGELVDIIEWTDETSTRIVYRFERHNNEIKYAAKLTVREGQTAVFINEGKIADVFGPGMYRLETKNLPILSTLKGWAYGFESPFKAEVYFVKTTRFVDQKWGTKNPIIMRDPDFGAVRVRAFGTYAMKVADPGKFIQEIVGTDGDFTTEEITDQLRNLIVSRFSDRVAETKIPVLDLAASYNELGDFLREYLKNDMEVYGIDLSQLLVENISVPPAVEKALDKRAEIGAMGDLGKLAAYNEAQAITTRAEALQSAAENPAQGGMSDALGLGMGVAMAGQFLNPQQRGAATGGMGAAPAMGAGMMGMTPPPAPVATMYHVAVNGQTTGPYAIAQLQQGAASGQFSPSSQVWAPGMSGWQPASQVPELAMLFQAPPPPPPAAPPPPPSS